MAFCNQCGTKLESGMAFCPSCGAKAEPAGASPIVEPPKVEVVEENREAGYGAMAVLAYSGILFLVPWLAGKGSRFAQFHANQGLVLLLASLAVNLGLGLLQLLFRAFLPILGSVASFLSTGASIALAVFGILGMVHCCKGRMEPLPLIGGIQILKQS